MWEVALLDATTSLVLLVEHLSGRAIMCLLCIIDAEYHAIAVWHTVSVLACAVGPE